MLCMTFRRITPAALSVLLLGMFSMQAADLDPKAITITLPKDLKWVENPEGYASAVVRGDPTKEGEYAMLVKWHPGKMSKPHYHPNDRFIYVISGTWWVGTGEKYDPDNMTPIKAGSFVTHYAKGIHYDGAKDEEATLEIVGIGPQTSTNAEKK